MKTILIFLVIIITVSSIPFGGSCFSRQEGLDGKVYYFEVDCNPPPPPFIYPNYDLGELRYFCFTASSCWPGQSGKL